MRFIKAEGKTLKQMETNLKHKKLIIELLKDIRTVNLDIEQEFNFGNVHKAQNKRDYWVTRFEALYEKTLRKNHLTLTYVHAFQGLSLTSYKERREITFDNI